MKIKFRVYDKADKKYIDEYPLIDIDGELLFQDQTDGHLFEKGHSVFIIEQFTGFQDSEGKDIYEGDIVIGLWDGELDYSSQKVKVEFKNGAFRENYFNRPIADYIQNYRCKIKIIGNTHEVNS